MSIVKKAQKKLEKEAKRAIQYPRSVEAEPMTDPAEAKRELTELTKKELVAMAKELGLSTKGNKADILERLGV